jgi:outer membrane biosynthesis protein TonB
MDFDDEAEPPPQSVWKRYRVGIIATAVVLVGIVIVAKLASTGGSKKHETLTLVRLAPPPPPPVMTPPPPPPPQQEEQKMEQPMIKEEQPQEAPKNEPLSTGIKGDGPDSFGLSNKPGNDRFGPESAKGTKWRSYATQVQVRIQQALQQNRKTRSARLSVQVRVWPDPSGRIKRAQLAGSTGDVSLDTAIRDEVLTGLQLDQPPPPDMPAPITLRLAARRP